MKGKLFQLWLNGWFDAFAETNFPFHSKHTSKSIASGIFLEFSRFVFDWKQFG